MKNKKCRSFARGDDIQMTDTHIQAVIDAMNEVALLTRIL